MPSFRFCSPKSPDLIMKIGEELGTKTYYLSDESLFSEEMLGILVLLEIGNLVSDTVLV